MLFTIEDISNYLNEFLESMRSVKNFDVKTTEDLYRLFIFCHLFSWGVLIWKLRGAL
jgi:hypothetical protein